LRDAERIQAYIRATAARLKDVVPVPPFTALIHPRNPLSYLSFAVPDRPLRGDLAEPLARLVDAFRERDRTARFEYVAEFAPELGPSLEEFGFELELRAPLMVCDRRSARQPPAVSGLRIARLHPQSPLDEVKTLVATGRRAFGVQEPATDEDADEDRGRLDRDISILGYLGGEPAAVAHAMAPVGGLSEVGGIGTLAEFRGRGIGGAMTSEVTQLAFGAGAEVVYLTPGDDGAFRVYERVGYRVAETMLFYALTSP
jgi:ribosomal protein S18 acetylase RimI-like enzyme